MAVETQYKNLFNCPVCGFPVNNQTDFTGLGSKKELHLSCPSCQNKLTMRRKGKFISAFFPIALMGFFRFEQNFINNFGEWGQTIFWSLLLGIGILWIIIILNPTYEIEAEMKGVGS
jgi:hypothetical protein